MDVVDYVNDLPPSSRLGALRDFLQEETLEAPVDLYRRSIGKILRYGTEERLIESDFIGRLLVIGIVSAAEAYFRAVLSACIELCPIAQSTASEKMINLGGLLWHGQAGFSRSAFEHTSFSSKSELTNACKQFLGIKLEDGIFADLLDQFEVVCQLRHGIVHGDGLLPGRNAVKLDIQKYKKLVRIVVRYEQIQDVAAVVNTLIMTLNRQLFFEMCKRWAVEWRRRTDWVPSLETRSFGYIWRIFYCTEEAKRAKGRPASPMKHCLESVKALYSI